MVQSTSPSLGSGPERFLTAAHEAEVVIETRGLTKTYGSQSAVDALSLQVPKGGVFGLLGPNGSGKTTTIAMLLGLVKPTRGSFVLFGEECTAPSEQALRRIGAIVESPAFYPYLSGKDNLRYFQGIARRGKPADIDHVLELVELSSRANSHYKTYSLGMKQRLGIAYGLLGEPELLFLDEPTNGLDPAGVVEVRELIRRLGDGGRTVVLSSHLLHEIEQICDYVAIIARGKLVTQGRVADLLSGHGEIRLKTTDNDKAVRVIRTLSGVAEISQANGYVVVRTSADMAAELSKALAANETYVTEMQPVQRTLERFFLEVTGEEALATSEVVR